MRTEGYVVVTLKFKKEGKKWTAYCEELGTATFAYTLKDAQKRIQEAVLLHLNTLEDVGECKRFLREHNITFYTHKPKKSDITMSGPFDPDTLSSPYIHPL